MTAPDPFPPRDPFLPPGAIAHALREVDWNRSPLGAPGTWSPALRATFAILLRSAAQIVLFWGADFAALYNDAYAPTIGAKHPAALGRPARDSWSELWDDLEPLLRGVRETGRTFAATDRPFYIERHGFGETVHFDVSYSAVPEADGGVGGVLCIVSETTERVRATAALRENERRFRALVTASAGVVWRMSPDWQEMRALEGAGILPASPGTARTWLTTYVHPEDRPVLEQAIADAIRSRRPLDIEHRVRLPADRQLWMHSRAVPILDDSGRITEWFGSASDVTERKRAELALARSEAFSRRILASSDDCIKVLTLSGRVEMVSEGGMRALALPEGEPWLGRDWARDFEPEDREAAAAAVARAAAGETTRFEARMRNRSGTPLHWDSVCTPIPDAAGRPEKILVISRDITDRVLAEDRLRRSEIRFRGVFESNAAGFSIVDIPSARAVAVNDCLLSITGHDRADYEDGRWDWRGLTPAEHHALDEAALAEARTLGSWRPYEKELIHRDGRRVPVRVSSAPLPGKPGRVVGVVADLTEARAAEAALRASEEQLRLATEAGEIGLWDVEDGHGALFWPPRVKAMFGISPDAPVSMDDFYACLHPEDRDRVSAAFAAAADPARRALYDVEYRTLGKEDGRLRWVAAKGRGVFAPDGRCLRVIGTAIDITARKHAEAALAQSEARLRELNETLADRIATRTRELESAHEALRQAQKMEAVGQLTGGIAHDFNNLLQSIAGSLDLIRRRSEDPARVRGWAEAGLRAAERGGRLASQLLAFSRTQALQIRPLPLARVLGALREMLERTIGPAIRIQFTIERDDLHVLGDEVQLEMAILNLALNARDAMPAGGDLDITVTRRQLERHPELAPGPYVEIAVRDTGAGMSPETAARAFEPFFTTKGVGRGTGLGLAQVYAAVHQAGGAVDIDSAPGEGTTIRLMLRPAEPGPAAEPEAAPALARNGASARILVIDDDDEVRSVLAAALDMLGYATVIAADGDAALASLDGPPPDAAILDYAMPGRNGAEVARALRARRPDLPILFASGYAETAAIAAAAGQDAPVLRKPFTLDELQRALEDALGRS